MKALISLFIATLLMPSLESCVSKTHTGLKYAPHGPADRIEQPNGEVASYKVRLDVQQGKCIFSYDGPFKGQIETGLIAPCEFLRDPAGKVRRVELKNTNQNGGGSYFVIVLVGGPPANQGHFDQYMKNGCGSESQTVSLSSRGVKLGGHGYALDICPTSSFDEKLFTADSAHI
jgi:hypothetical protein